MAAEPVRPGHGPDELDPVVVPRPRPRPVDPALRRVLVLVGDGLQDHPDRRQRGTGRLRHRSRRGGTWDGPPANGGGGDRGVSAESEQRRRDHARVQERNPEREGGALQGRGLVHRVELHPLLRYRLLPNVYVGGET